MSVTISVTPAAATTKVTLCTSRTTDGLPETIGASDLPVTSGTVTTAWYTSALPSGDHCLFAVTDDGRNAPITTHHATPITIDTAGLAPRRQSRCCITCSLCPHGPPACRRAPRRAGMRYRGRQ